MRTIRVLALALIAAVPAVASAQTAPPIKYETFTLPNGLRFVVHEDRSTPIVAINVYYDVGSANEADKRSGFAHLFEHMLFEETQNLEKGEFTRYIETTGASNQFFNGTTDQDRTMYYEVVPSNRVNMALWLEAERMGRLRVTEDNFKREREVVKEERRMRIDNAPYMAGFLTLDTLYTDYKPYRHTVIGSMDDLNAATVDDVLNFYRQYYGPNNATVVLAGDITVEQAKKYANEYFAWIPRSKDVLPLPAPAPAPRSDGERRATVTDKLASIPMLFAGYTIPEHAHKDVYALQLLANILGQGESSRLNQALVKEAKIANFVGIFPLSRNKGGMLALQAQPTQGNDVTKLEEQVWTQVDKVRNEGVTQQELDKAKRSFVAGQIMQRQTVLMKSSALQHARFMHGDLANVNEDIANYQAVTLDDIRRVAQKYLTPANRTVVTVVPQPKTTTSD